MILGAIVDAEKEAESEIEAKIDKVNRVDLNKCIYYKYKKGYREADIARLMKVSPQAIDQALQPIKSLYKNNPAVQHINSNYTDILRNVTSNMLLHLVDEKKLKEASLNNVAYSFSQVAKELHLAESTPTDLTASALIVKDIEDLRNQANQLTKQLREEETPVDNL